MTILGSPVFISPTKTPEAFYSWEKVSAIDWEERAIKVSDLGEADKESKESMAKAVLLRAGILDALVLDLQNRRATRANDLLLEEKDHQLFLKSR